MTTVEDGSADLALTARSLYEDFGQRKDMGTAAPRSTLPHFFLLRQFLGQNDLLVILNTKRCRYQCLFCELPAKSSRNWIPLEDVVAQFSTALHECKHALSILDRMTLSNEGSVLDSTTLDPLALESIFLAINEIKRVRTVVLETRMEFVATQQLQALNALASRVAIEILTGFETVDPIIRDDILGKREPIEVFLTGLDRLSLVPRARLTAYVLFKPDPRMTDEEAIDEASDAINFLRRETGTRAIPLTIRLNPMYVARGSYWEKLAVDAGYKPPRLTDALKLAVRTVEEGTPVYLGLSAESLADTDGTYMSREDFSPDLMKAALRFNSSQLSPAAR